MVQLSSPLNGECGTVEIESRWTAQRRGGKLLADRAEPAV